jgi:uncharacterized membrane protein
VNTSTIGLFAGLLVALAATTGGFVGFLLALVLGAAGFAVGLFADSGSKPFDDMLSRRRRS